MTLPEAIVYLLASSNRGMKTDRIAAEINARGLYRRKDGMPVDGKQVSDSRSTFGGIGGS